jgi:hypothetical protein
MNLQLKTEPNEVLNYLQIKDMSKGDKAVYFVGTTQEAHRGDNKQQMRVIKEAITNGLAVSTQKIIETTVKKRGDEVVIENILAYAVVRV